jgi:cytidylate kinase
MPTVKLTLSADEKVIRKARRLARKNNTSISAMFSRLVIAMSKRDEHGRKGELGPLTRKALGLVKLSRGKSDKELLEEALMQKYGFKK